MKKKLKNKKTTVDELARMVAHGFEKTATKDELAAGFQSVNEKLDRHSEILNGHSEILSRHSEVMEIILKEVQETNKEAREQRRTISVLNRSDISQEREIQDLKLRVETLEEKVK